MQTETTDLNTLFPERAEFTLSATGKTYQLRPVTVDDHKWLKAKFNGQTQGVQEAFNKRDWDILGKLIYRFLVDKSDFMPKQVEEIDDDGNPIQINLTGPQLFTRAIRSDEEAEVLTAFAKNMVDSNPVVRDAVAYEVKKKMSEMQREEMSIGPLSSMPSNPSTDGQMNTSLGSPSDESTSP